MSDETRRSQRYRASSQLKNDGPPQSYARGDPPSPATSLDERQPGSPSEISVAPGTETTDCEVAVDAHAPPVVGDPAGKRFDASDVVTPLLKCIPSHWPHLRRVPNIGRVRGTIMTGRGPRSERCSACQSKPHLPLHPDSPRTSPAEVRNVATTLRAATSVERHERAQLGACVVCDGGLVSTGAERRIADLEYLETVR